MCACVRGYMLLCTMRAVCDAVLLCCCVPLCCGVLCVLFASSPSPLHCSSCSAVCGVCRSLYTNMLTGVLPAAMGQMTLLQYVYNLLPSCAVRCCACALCCVVLCCVLCVLNVPCHVCCHVLLCVPFVCVCVAVCCVLCAVCDAALVCRVCVGYMLLCAMRAVCDAVLLCCCVPLCCGVLCVLFAPSPSPLALLIMLCCVRCVQVPVQQHVDRCVARAMGQMTSLQTCTTSSPRVLCGACALLCCAVLCV